MAEKSFQLTERDLQVLIDLYKMRYLSVSQIRKLHFPSDQTAYRRLRALRSLGFAKSFNVANIDEGVFYLAKHGAELVADQLGLSNGDLPIRSSATTPKDYYFLRHFLAINDFRIALSQACENSPIKLLGFIPEYVGERSKNGGVKKYIRDVVSGISNGPDAIGHTPDAVFALEKSGKAALFFLEIDRGTETVVDSSKGLLKSVLFYLSLLSSGRYRRYAGDFNCTPFQGFRALFVVPTENRLLNLRQASMAITVQDRLKRFIWIASSDQVQSSPGPLITNWRSLDPTDQSVYGILK